MSSHSPRFSIYIRFQDMTTDFDPSKREANYVSEKEYLACRNSHPGLTMDDVLGILQKETGRDPDYLYHCIPNEAVCRMLRKIPNVSIHPCFDSPKLGRVEKTSVQMFCQDFMKDRKNFFHVEEERDGERINLCPETDAVMTKDTRLWRERAEAGGFSILLTDDPGIKPIGVNGIAVDPKSRYAPQYIRNCYGEFYKEHERIRELDRKSMAFLEPDPTERRKIREDWLRQNPEEEMER